MTEQELRQEFKNHSDCYSDSSEMIHAMTEDAAIDLAKAYADARESKEIAELKAANKLSSSAWRKDCEERDDKITQLNAENKRLRDALLWLKENRMPDRAMIEVFIDKVLSPAPVTDGNETESPCRTCLRIRSTIEGYCRICDTDFSPKNEDQQ